MTVAATMIQLEQKSVFFPMPPLYTTILPPGTLLFLICLCFREIRGKPLQYSKFANVGASTAQIKISSFAGMLAAYAPAFLAGISSFAIFPAAAHGVRFLLVRLFLTLHFFKRNMEVMFVHKYSGSMMLGTVIIISLSYVFSAASLIYVQSLTIGSPEPAVDLSYPGILLFLVGIFGNLYHHYLLSKLRKEGDKGYKIPRGGLFSLVICPHYLFEIMAFIGIACISQTLYSLSFAIGSGLYLAGRSYMTRKWYLSKFEDFPLEIKALIPYVF